MMPKKNKHNLKREEKQLIIKDVALKLFAENGYEATSVNEISKKAEISKGLIYHYFSSKEELLKVIWDEILDGFNFITFEEGKTEVSDMEAEDFIDKYFDMCKKNRPQWKLYYQLFFQPKVIEYFTEIYTKNKPTQRTQSLILEYFGKKADGSNIQFGMFTSLVFIKGLAMVTTYTEDVYSN